MASSPYPSPEPGASPPRRRDHWESIYRERDDAEVSWHQPDPSPSLRLLDPCLNEPGTRVIDVGGGTSRLAGLLLELGHRPTVLDISEAALDRCRERLGPRASQVHWIRADITDFRPEEPWDLWHDRALLHFLLDSADREAYREALLAGLRPGGCFVWGSFAPDGPERCSGLSVERYGVEEMQEWLGEEFTLEEAFREEHEKPMGGTQRFQFARFRRFHSERIPLPVTTD